MSVEKSLAGLADYVRCCSPSMKTAEFIRYVLGDRELCRAVGLRWNTRPTKRDVDDARRTLAELSNALGSLQRGRA